MCPRQPDAADKVRMGGNHAALLVVGIAEAAKRPRLAQHRSGRARVAEGALVGGKAPVHVAHREIQVAAQRFDLGQPLGLAQFGGGLLGLAQR
ncbi:hypothetical protein D9M72_510250 [compost metagenome]